MCRLIYDALDNAVYACIHSMQDKKELYILLKRETYRYTFYVKNTIDISVLKENPNLKTTKANSSHHGNGIGIMRDIAAKYDGECDFYEEDGLFCVAIYLPINF